MANKSLFKSGRADIANEINNAGGKAYSLTPKQALANLAAVGHLGGTFYCNENDQLNKIIELSKGVDDEFLAKLAIYSRKKAFLKDMPALILAILSTRNPALVKKISDKILDNGRMVRNFVQIIRSGVTGRKSLGTVPKKVVKKYIETASTRRLFFDSVGQSPSIKDIIKMVHPKPSSQEQANFFGYIVGSYDPNKKYPKIITEYEEFKADPSGAIPDAPFRKLTNTKLSTDQWKSIARNAPWHMTRMNLNTFIRHGVFEDPEIIKIVASRLRDPKLIKKVRVYPYQLMAAYMNAQKAPSEIRLALQDAMDIAIENIDPFDGKIYIFPDVSGSMSQPVTGYRGSATTSVRCVQVAGLMTSVFLNKNKNTIVMPFDTRIRCVSLNPRDSIMTNAKKLNIRGGGTSISLPMRQLNENRLDGDVIIYISDNESWCDPSSWSGTSLMNEWIKFKRRNPLAKMVCIDLAPYGTTQAKTSSDVLNVGGFSDAVFSVIREFIKHGNSADAFVDCINAIDL